MRANPFDPASCMSVPEGVGPVFPVGYRVAGVVDDAVSSFTGGAGMDVGEAYYTVHRPFVEAPVEVIVSHGLSTSNPTTSDVVRITTSIPASPRVIM